MRRTRARMRRAQRRTRNDRRRSSSSWRPRTFGGHRVPETGTRPAVLVRYRESAAGELRVPKQPSVVVPPTRPITMTAPSLLSVCNTEDETAEITTRGPTRGKPACTRVVIANHAAGIDLRLARPPSARLSGKFAAIGGTPRPGLTQAPRVEYTDRCEIGIQTSHAGSEARPARGERGVPRQIACPNDRNIRWQVEIRRHERHCIHRVDT